MFYKTKNECSLWHYHYHSRDISCSVRACLSLWVMYWVQAWFFLDLVILLIYQFPAIFFSTSVIICIGVCIWLADWKLAWLLSELSSKIILLFHWVFPTSNVSSMYLCECYKWTSLMHLRYYNCGKSAQFDFLNSMGSFQPQMPLTYSLPSLHT